jgi:pimeloyl-ACP methyl ester carboxylesterase
MQRPVMNPTFYEEAHSRHERFHAIRVVGRALMRVVRLFFRTLAYDPLRRRLRVEDGPFLARFVRGIFYRLAFVPVLIAIGVCVMVYFATHPRTYQQDMDPASLELYYDSVTFLTADQIRLDAYLYPVINARQVLEEQEKALRKRYPAVVLVHDFGMTRQQMLPLVRPLHDAGFVVLAMNLRGNGASGAAAQTFGLREALDVKAAVEMLRRRPFVDASRIVLVGAGTGATAAMLHAKSDPAIPVIVAADPVMTVDSLLDGKLAPRQEYLAWMRSLCKWTFEIGYQLDADDVDWSEFDRVRDSRPVLVLGGDGGHTDFSRPRHIDEIRSFLVQQVIEPKLPVAKTEC